MKISAKKYNRLLFKQPFRDFLSGKVFMFAGAVTFTFEKLSKTQ